MFRLCFFVLVVRSLHILQVAGAFSASSLQKMRIENASGNLRSDTKFHESCKFLASFFLHKFLARSLLEFCIVSGVWRFGRIPEFNIRNGAKNY
jgi:hypothetical protein